MKYLKPYKRFIVIFLAILLTNLLIIWVLGPDKPIKMLGYDISSILVSSILPIGLLSSLLQMLFTFILHDWVINPFGLPFYLISMFIFAIFIHNIISLLLPFIKTKKVLSK